MEKQIKVEYHPVDIDQYSELILLINSQAYYGDIDALKEIILDHVDNGGDIDECYLGEYRSFKGTEMKIKKTVTVELSERDYDEQEAEYVIYDGRREVDRFSCEQDALEELASLIEKSGDEYKYNLGYEPKFISLYNVEAEEDVEIHIPEQRGEIEVIEVNPIPVEGMSGEELNTELTQLMSRLAAITQEINDRTF